MTLVSSGPLSIKNVGDAKGLPSVNLSLGALSTTNVNITNPAAKVPANTSSAAGNWPDELRPDRLSEFYAYNHGFATTTTVAPATTTTTTRAPTTTTTTAGVTTTSTIGPTTTSTVPPVVSWFVNPSKLSVQEGSSVTFLVTTTGIPDGTPFYFTTAVKSGKVTGDTFGPPAYSMYGGPFYIFSGAGSFVRNIVNYPASGPLSSDTADDSANGPESFTVKIRTGSVSGYVVVESAVVSIVELTTTTTTNASTTTTSTTTSTSTSTTTTTTLAPVSIGYAYNQSCSTAGHSFALVVNGTTVLNISATQSGTITIMPGDTIYATVTIKPAQCGTCVPHIIETGTYTGDFSGSCPSQASTVRTISSGQTLSYTASDSPGL